MWSMNSSSMADPTSMSNTKDQYQTLINSLNGGQSNDSIDSILSNTALKQIKAKMITSRKIYQKKSSFDSFFENKANKSTRSSNDKQR